LGLQNGAKSANCSDLIQTVVPTASGYGRTFIPVAEQLNSGPDRLIVGVSRPHAVRHTTLGRTPLDEGLARRRDLYP